VTDGDDSHGGTRILWYFADPMCSWCWGFAPVVRAIRDTYGDRLRVALILGGLRPGTREPITQQLREDILHHWHEVQRHTGQAFIFEDALPDGFVYDTEPPSRAVITVAELQQRSILEYLESVQAAFYAAQQDVTQADTLARLAARIGIDTGQFQNIFESDRARQRTREHFQRTRDAGVRGFPTLVGQGSSGFSLLTAGYRPFNDLRPVIDTWLQDQP